MADDPRLTDLSAAPLPEYMERRYIPDGIKGTEATIQEMRKLTASGCRDWRIRMLLGKIVRDSGCEPKSWECIAKSIYLYCRDKVTYLYDPKFSEYLEDPARIPVETGGSGVADCDSVCMLEASLFLSAGFDCNFVTIKGTPGSDEFTHVFCEVKYPGSQGFVGADATMPNKDWKWSPPPQFERRAWPASTDETANEGTSGMSGFGETNDFPSIVGEAPAVSVNVNRWSQMTFSEMNEPSTTDQIEESITGLSGFGDYDSLTNQFNQVQYAFRTGIFAAPESQASSVRSEVDSINNALNDFEAHWMPAVKSGQKSEAAAVSTLQNISNRMNDIGTKISTMTATPVAEVPVPVPGGGLVSPTTGLPVVTSSGFLPSAPASNKTMLYVAGGLAVVALGYFLWKGRKH